MYYSFSLVLSGVLTLLFCFANYLLVLFKSPNSLFPLQGTSVTLTSFAVCSFYGLFISLPALLFIEMILVLVYSLHSPLCVPSPQISPVFFALCTKSTLFSLLFFAGPPPRPAALVRNENGSTLPPSSSLSPYEW